MSRTFLTGKRSAAALRILGGERTRRDLRAPPPILRVDDGRCGHSRLAQGIALSSQQGCQAIRAPGPAMGSWRDRGPASNSDWPGSKMSTRDARSRRARPVPPTMSSPCSLPVITSRTRIASDANVPRSTKRKARALVRESVELKVCADLANRSKHSALTHTRTGDPSTGPSRQDVTVMLGQGSGTEACSL